jgi:hypothetical protein
MVISTFISIRFARIESQAARTKRVPAKRLLGGHAGHPERQRHQHDQEPPVAPEHRRAHPRHRARFSFPGFESGLIDRAFDRGRQVRRRIGRRGNLHGGGAEVDRHRSHARQAADRFFNAHRAIGAIQAEQIEDQLVRTTSLNAGAIAVRLDRGNQRRAIESIGIEFDPGTTRGR